MRGGKRKGAGRKPNGIETKMFGLRLPKSLIEGLSNEFPTIKERNEYVKQQLQKALEALKQTKL